ncbi:MAG: nickel-responsive transcriptional regulator NikR [bacterium]|nr:nickel-responsive transcriptional regulator NikR [bacterium]
MSSLVRFGVSVEEELLSRFDRLIQKEAYANRSEAIRDLIREHLVKREWVEGKEVAGTITLVYDHHRRELVNKLTDIQHDFHNLVISSQHIHLDHDNCLEVVVVKGTASEVNDLAHRLKSTKGVKYGALNMATTGRELV